jgi:hypothetical protein
VHLTTYLRLLYSAEGLLEKTFQRSARRYEHLGGDVATRCAAMAGECGRRRGVLGDFIDRYAEPALIEGPLVLPGMRDGAASPTQDLRDLRALAGLVLSAWDVCKQTADAHDDADLLVLAEAAKTEVSVQLRWLEEHPVYGAEPGGPALAEAASG